MSQELYEKPRTELSQGDILEVSPHVFLDPPLSVLHPVGNDLHKSEKEPFSTFNDSNGQSIIATCKRAKAIVITADCEIDKKSVSRWHLCPIVPLSVLKGEVHGDVKRNRVYSKFFLPGYSNVLPDSFVDFNQLSTVGADFIRTGKRVTSLSDLGRQGLYAQFIRWLTRWELKDLTCPNCNVQFSPAFQVR